MPGDHKRKARPIEPATVTVGPGSITVVVPDVLGKNASHVQSKGGGRRISEQTEVYRGAVRQAAWEYAERECRGPFIALHANAAVGKVDMNTCMMPWTTAWQGAWRLEVIGVWPKKRDEVAGKPADFLIPLGDADAAIPQALDALQYAGILDDDARVVEVRAWNLYRKGVRATVMRLVRVPPIRMDSMYIPGAVPERDAAIAHLLPLVPRSPEPSAKPARKRKDKST